MSRRPAAPWRYLAGDGVGAAAGLALDEAMMLHYGRGETPAWPATLRLYTYRPHCALVGRYQNLEEEVDLEACRELGIEVGRRPTGGGAIIMGPGQLGVAIAARAVPDETPRDALRRYAAGVVAGLARLGIEARFRRKNDLEVGERKIAGLGLYLDPRGAILFHSSVLLDLDVELMLRVLRIPGAKLSDKAVARVEERVTTVNRELGRSLDFDAARDEFSRGVAEAFGVPLDPAALEADEEERREQLIESRYGRQEWVFQRSPRRDARGSAMLKTPAGLMRIYVAVHGAVIKSVLVAGDFNVMPPCVSRLEAALRWCGARREAIARAAAAIDPGELGIDLRPLVDAVWEATAAALALQEEGHPRRLEGPCYFPEPGQEPVPAAVRSGGEEAE